jgi:hypothetical protein
VLDTAELEVVSRLWAGLGCLWINDSWVLASEWGKDGKETLICGFVMIAIGGIPTVFGRWRIRQNSVDCSSLSDRPETERS